MYFLMVVDLFKIKHNFFVEYLITLNHWFPSKTTCATPQQQRDSTSRHNTIRRHRHSLTVRYFGGLQAILRLEHPDGAGLLAAGHPGLQLAMDVLIEHRYGFDAWESNAARSTTQAIVCPVRIAARTRLRQSSGRFGSGRYFPPSPLGGAPCPPRWVSSPPNYFGKC